MIKDNLMKTLIFIIGFLVPIIMVLVIAYVLAGWETAVFLFNILWIGLVTILGLTILCLVIVWWSNFIGEWFNKY